MEHAERSWKCRTNDNFHLWRYSKCKTILVWPDGTETTCDGATDPTRVMEHAESSWKCRTNDNDSYPLMRRLHEILREEEPPAILSRSAVLASMAQPAVLNSMPHCILKRLPKEKLRSLSSDVFFVLQMLVCMEIPSTKLEDLPGPLRVEALTQKIQLHREKYLQENRSELGFTAEDVKDSFRVFSNSHKAFGRCLRGILGIQHSQPLEQKLDELTDMFFEDVTEFSSGYTPGSVAVAVLLYQLAPCDESSTRPHVAEPRREIICKPSWRLREDISRCRGVRARYGTCSQSHACILASLGRES